jgi:hypothetical protein
MRGSPITSEQIAASRSAIDWAVNELSLKSGVGTATIKRYESVAGLPNSRRDILGIPKRRFASAGMELIGIPEGAPGICIHGGGPST